MPRFKPTRNNMGIPAINDSERNRLVALFFIDRSNAEAADKMRDVCCDALNAAVHGAPPKPMQGRQVRT